ncbi:hypothetical protein Q8A73_016452 [Channa argus]|nr:hypothetical protein Q8A73_016452 [Channa argus]
MDFTWVVHSEPEEKQHGESQRLTSSRIQDHPMIILTKQEKKRTELKQHRSCFVFKSNSYMSKVQHRVQFDYTGVLGLKPVYPGQRDVTPNITLHPAWENGFWATPVRLICTLSGFFPDKWDVEWKKDNRALSIGETKQKLRTMVGVEETYSLSSEIKPNIGEWEKGSDFTCSSKLNTALTKTINICNVHSASPPSIHVETPSFKTVMMATSEVTATCSVQSDFDAKVTWLMDGRAAQSNTVTQNRNMTIIISTLRVSSSQWKGLNRVTCRAEHKCFSTTEKNVDVAGPAVTAPSVEIRRSLPDLLKGNSVVLVCDVTQLSSSDLYITFQANNADISEKLYVDLPESPGPHSVSRTFSVPSNHWKKGTSFTCTVNQGFSRNFKSQSTGNIFVDPSVELLVVPSEESGPQKLSCSGSGFNPQIQWFFETQQRSSSTHDISVAADGRVTVTSQLHVPQAEWKTEKVFTCEVSDRSLSTKVRKDISLFSASMSCDAKKREDHMPSIRVTLNRPSPKEMFNNKQAVLECVITGQNKTIVNEAEIKWQIDGKNVIGTSEPTKPDGKEHSKSSTLTRSPTEWAKVNKVSCSAVREDMTPVIRELTVNKGDGSEPKVIVLPQENMNNPSEITLMCLVSSPVLQDYYITWSEDEGHSNRNYVDGINFPPQKTQRMRPWNHMECLKARIAHVNVTSKGVSTSVSCDEDHPCSTLGYEDHLHPIPPQVTLLSVVYEDTQVLMCMIEDSHSGTLQSFKWKKNGAEVADFIQSPFQGIGDSHSGVSVLKVKNTEWDSKAVYTCEVTYQGQTYTKKVSKDPITVTLNQPSPKEMFTNNQAVLDCAITGQDKAVVDEIEITWKIDGENVTGQTGVTTSEDGQYRKTSTMTRSHTEWKAAKKVSCSAVKEDMMPIVQDLTVNKGDGSEPKVTVLIEEIKPSEVTVVCLVSSSVLQDYYIAWSELKENVSGNYVNGINFPEQKTPKGYLVTSVYTTTKTESETKVFNCNVWPAGRNEAMTPHGVSLPQGFITVMAMVALR